MSYFSLRSAAGLSPKNMVADRWPRLPGRGVLVRGGACNLEGGGVRFKRNIHFGGECGCRDTCSKGVYVYALRDGAPINANALSWEQRAVLSKSFPQPAVCPNACYHDINNRRHHEQATFGRQTTTDPFRPPNRASRKIPNKVQTL